MHTYRDTKAAAWLPQAAQKITILLASESYDDMIVHVDAARDWRDRGESYLRSIADTDDDYRILAVIPGHVESAFGCAIKSD